MNNTNMKYQVIKRHQSEFPNPVIISRGEKLVIGEKYEENKAWNDWYFCETEDRNKGWVPKQVLQWLGGSVGEALEDYSARELNAEEGEVLAGSQALNGWIWCRNPASGEQGWVPVENLLPMGADTEGR